MNGHAPKYAHVVASFPTSAHNEVSNLETITLMKNLSGGLLLLIILASCQGDETRSGRCNLTPDPGPCKALFPKYYFDKSEGKCNEFSWGGCDGVVPFDTLEECKQCECTESRDT